MSKQGKFFILATIICAAICALIGVFYSAENTYPTVRSLYGVEVDLYGKGAYQLMSTFRAGTFIATDYIILIMSTLLIIFYKNYIKQHKVIRLLYPSGFLFISYYALSLVFGTPLFHFFLLYVLLLFLSTLSLFITVKDVLSIGISPDTLSITFKKTSLFLMIASFSSLIWLSLLIPAMLKNDYQSIVDLNTTEPTFAIDIAFIFPLFLTTSILLFKQKVIGYQLTPMLLTFYSFVGLLVIAQTIVQSHLGIVIGLNELITLVISFSTLGFISAIMNHHFLKKINLENG